MGLSDSGDVVSVIEALSRSDPLVGLVNGDDELIWRNEAFDSTFLRGLSLPVSFSEMLRHGFASGFGVHIDCGDIEEFLKTSNPLRRSQRYRAFPIDLVDGRWIWMTETLLDDGALLLVATDITRLKTHESVLVQAHRTALEASLTDELTGASNRRHILALCREALEQQTQGHHFWVVMLDLDHFKAINDRHGHEGGDKVLRHFVAHCRARLRPEDRLGRVGGEEFMLLLPGDSANAAEQVVERLRATLTSADGIAYTFSAGVARAQAGLSVEAVVALADGALYQAKANGRARTVVLPSP